MSLFYLPFLPSHVRLLEELSGGVARSCLGKIRARIGLRAVGMTPAEAKGYARAVVSDLLRNEVIARVDRYALDRRLGAPVFALAIEQALDLVVPRLVSKPSRAELRRAA